MRMRCRSRSCNAAASGYGSSRKTGNDQDPRALLVTDRDEVALDYVPGPLLDLVHELSDREATVLRANGPEVGFHFRLLVLLAGRAPEGYRPFTGPDWETTGRR
jgi:hypothetical protein